MTTNYAEQLEDLMGKEWCDENFPSVKLMVNHFLVNGNRVEFKDLTPELEAYYRLVAKQQRQPRSRKPATKRSRAGKRFMHRGYSPADAIVAGDILGINKNKI